MLVLFLSIYILCYFVLHFRRIFPQFFIISLQLFDSYSNIYFLQILILLTKTYDNPLTFDASYRLNYPVGYKV